MQFESNIPSLKFLYFHQAAGQRFEPCRIIAHGLFRNLASSDVTHHSNHHTRLSHIQRTQHDVDGKSRAILASAIKFAWAGDRSVRFTGLTALAEYYAFGYQGIDRLSHKFASRVAKHPLDLHIDVRNFPFVTNNEDRIGCRLKQPA